MRALLLCVVALLGCYSERVEVDLVGDCDRMMGGAARFAATVRVGTKTYGAPMVFSPLCSFHIDVPCSPGDAVTVRVSALDRNGRYLQEKTRTGRCDGFSRVASADATEENPPPDALLYAVAGGGDEVVMVGEEAKANPNGVVSTFDGISFIDVQFPSPPGPLRHVWFDPPNQEFFAVGDGNLNLAVGMFGTDRGRCPMGLPGGVSFAGLFAGQAILKNNEMMPPKFAFRTIKSLNLSNCNLPGNQTGTEDNIVAFGPSGDFGVRIDGSGQWTWVNGDSGMQTPPRTMNANAVASTRDYGCVIVNGTITCPYKRMNDAPPVPGSDSGGFINLFTTQKALIGLTAQGALSVCHIGGRCGSVQTKQQGIKGLWASAHTLWLVGEPGVIRYDLRTLLDSLSGL